MSLQLGDPVLM